MTDADGVDGETRIAQLDETTFAVRDLIGASRDLTVRMARAMAMNATDMTAIHLLSEHGPMGAAELAERLGIRSASATVLVDRLEQAGHVERVRDTTDRRRVTLTATDAARAASVEAWLPGILDLDEVCRTLSGDDAVLARDFLRRLTAVMERTARG